MTEQVTTFKALRKAADNAGCRAMYQKGEQIGAPSYSTTAPLGLSEWTCKACGDRIKRDDSRGTAFRPCQCLINAYRDARLDVYQRLRGEVMEAELTGSGIDGIYQGCSFDNFTPRAGTEEALRMCREYAQGFDPDSPAGLYLFGPHGTGKTHLVSAVVRAVLSETDVSPLFVEAVHLLREIRQRRDGDKDVVQECIRAPLLVVDDLGNAYNTAFAQEQLHAIISGRYKAGLPTLVTTNCDGGDLGAILGSTLVSRLFQMCRPVEMTATDYRAEHRPGAKSEQEVQD